MRVVILMLYLVPQSDQKPEAVILGNPCRRGHFGQSRHSFRLQCLIAPNLVTQKTAASFAPRFELTIVNMFSAVISVKKVCAKPMIVVTMKSSDLNSTWGLLKI